MAHLTLTGVSDDGKRLLLVSDKGVEFTLDITPSLRAALSGDTSRIGQLEIQMESALRPRDIQARIRAGETPEAVAQAAQTTVDKIMTYAGPVLAEREHVAERAQRSSVRRAPGESAGGARTLGDAVAAHLRAANVDPGTVAWDAWRREDGRWSLTALFQTSERQGTAEFTYDAPGNYVVLDNDEARWLVGEVVAGAAPHRDDLEQARLRRLSAVPEDELPLGDDAIELVSHDETASLGAEAPVEAFLDDSPASDDPALREEAAEAAAQDDDEDDEPPARRQVQKKRGRASVPSWDEIMFGGGDQ
ncbi:MAG TPA: septation protein SepH [Nocardioides sp.]|nr:septation protein SepH [Nocardioides sp.]